MKYRVSAKGLLYKDGKVLFVEYSDSRGPYYSLPGGGHEMGESLQECVVREMKEEVGLDVVAGEMLMVREFILETSEVRGWEQGIHQVEVVFRCGQVDEAEEAMVGELPDNDMSAVRWIAVEDFDKHIIYPTNALKDVILSDKPIYLFK